MTHGNSNIAATAAATTHPTMSVCSATTCRAAVAMHVEGTLNKNTTPTAIPAILVSQPNSTSSTKETAASSADTIIARVTP